jgi:CheY-like chemotaxis protein
MERKRARLLVVDDEPDVVEQIQELLQDKYQVETATNFEEARAAYLRQPADLAILDIMGVNGSELLRLFHRTTPCMMLTAHALTPQHLKSTAAGGARLYLPKDELVRLPEYVEKLLSTPPRVSLWGWLLERVSFSRWFGAAWGPEDEQFLKDLTVEDIEHDLKIWS